MASKLPNSKFSKQGMKEARSNQDAHHHHHQVAPNHSPEQWNPECSCGVVARYFKWQ
uniref:Uncharacterized protein n=1 Tax=Arundo donax TaxID=35708 RepID=A0A0A9HF43_ARUDO